MSLTILLTLALANAVEAAPPPASVWGGYETPTGPEAVVALTVDRLDRPGLGRSFCSATLIAPELAVTAAHCLEGVERLLDDRYALFVGVGGAWPFEPVRVARTWVHPERRDGAGVDLAVLRLAEPAGVMPILAGSVPVGEGHTGMEVSIVGYGITGKGAEDGGVRRRADLEYIRRKGDLLVLHDGPAIEQASSANACNGDSGGATLAWVADIPVLVGVTAVAWNGCEGGSTGATPVADHLDWVRSVSGLGPESELEAPWPDAWSPSPPPADEPAMTLLPELLACDGTGGAGRGLGALAVLLALAVRRRHPVA